MKPPEFHAERQMRIRRITEAEVDEALANRETTYPSERRADRLVILGRTDAGRRLKIVVPMGDEETIITVADRDAAV